MSSTVKVAEELGIPVAQQLGLKLWDVRFEKEGSVWYLRYFIDKDGGVTIDDCERVHNAIDAKVEDIDISNGESYNLSVSSFGLTRQLKNTKELMYRLNEIIDIKLFSPVDNKKEYSGKLIEVKDDSIVLQIGNVTQEFLRKNIASAKLKIDF